MKNKKILIFVFLFSISFLFFNKKVFAEKTDVDFYDNNYNTGWYLAFGNYQSGLQLFKPNQPYIQKVYFKTRDYYNSLTPNSYCQNQTALLAECLSSDCFSRNIIATSTFTLSPETIIDFGTNINVIQGGLYAIYFYYNNIFPSCNISTHLLLNYGCNSTNGQDDSCYYNTGYYKSFSTVQPTLFFTNTIFKTTYDENNINIDFTPYTSAGGMDDYGSYKDFDFWQLDGNNSGTTTQLSLQIEYQKFGDDEKITDYMSFNPFVSNYPIRISMSKSEPLLNGFYTATATIVAFYDDSIDYLDYDVIHFYINNESGSSTFPFEEMTFFSDDTYDHICDDVATSSGEFWDDFRFGIECGFRKIVYWVIYPSDKSVNNLSKGYANLKKQFPFSAYFGITDTINESIASTTVNSNGTFNIPFINATGSYYMLPVLSSTSMPNLIGESNTNLFRYSITWFMWLCSAVLIFITIKKI